MAETVTADGASREASASRRRSLSDWPGWDYVPGIAFLVIGALALAEPPLASLAAGIYLGAMICIAGAFMLVGGIAGVKHRGAWLAILLGLLSIVAGLIILFNPVVGAVSLVWVIGAWFIVGGIFEIVSAFSIRAGRGWLIFVGIVNLVLGAYTIMLPPAAAFAFLGYLVGLSLIFRGAWSLMFTADLHRLHERVAGV